MRARVRRLMVPAVLSVMVVGGAAGGCEVSCGDALRPDARMVDASTDARVDGGVDAASDAPNDTPT
jgi:hypothetical protein